MSTDKTAPQNKPEAAIQQINLGYNVQQDRLLLKVGFICTHNFFASFVLLAIEKYNLNTILAIWA